MRRLFAFACLALIVAASPAQTERTVITAPAWRRRRAQLHRTAPTRQCQELIGRHKSQRVLVDLAFPTASIVQASPACRVSLRQHASTQRRGRRLCIVRPEPWYGSTKKLASTTIVALIITAIPSTVPICAKATL